MDEREARARFGDARVARLATVRGDGAPHVVPVTFAIDADLVWFAVDDKPKTTRRLARLRNIEREPRVALLVDEYDDDWRRLWWVRADGDARVTEQARDVERAAALLGAKYPESARRPPRGPAVVVVVRRWSSWSAR
jgi:PPOX class probable F420-dependent enzyme